MMTKFRQKLIGIFILLIIFVAGCQSNEDHLAHPYNLITDEFGFIPFESPDEWEVYAIDEIRPMKVPTNIANPEYEELPNQVDIYFGKRSKENTRDLEGFNNNQKTKNTGLRAKFMVSQDESFGRLTIKKYNHVIKNWEEAISGVNGLAVPFPEEYERVTIRDKEILYYVPPEHDEPWYYVWLSSDKKYRYVFAYDSMYKGSKSHEYTMSILQKLTLEIRKRG
jgi:hypothetical protein